MRRLGPAFPPDVAAALQERRGAVSVRYTVGARMARRRDVHLVVMGSYGRMVAQLSVDPSGRLCFTRTGDEDGPRTAKADVTHLLREGCHWDIALTWRPEELTVEVRDRDDAAAAPARGAWRA